MSDRKKGTGEVKLWNPYFILVVSITFTSYISFHGLNSGTSVYIETIGGSSAFAGILASVYSLVALCSRFLLGPVIDEKGRSLVMSLGATCFACGALLVGFLQSEPALVVGRVLQGVGFGAITTSAATAAADVLPKERLGEGLGLYGLGNALSLSVGPAVALFLVALEPPEMLFNVLALAAVGVFVLSRMCNYENRPEKLPETSAYRIRMEEAARKEAELSNKSDGLSEKPQENRGFRRFYEARALPGALPWMFATSANCFSVFFAGVYGASLGVGNAGAYFTFAAVVMIAVRLKSKAYMDKILPIKVQAFAMGAGVIGLVCLLGAPYFEPLFYAGGLFYGLELGVALPLNQSVSVKNTPAERWGAGNALFLIAGDAGVAVMSIVWGVLNDTFGFQASLMGAIACLVLSFVVACIAYPENAKRELSN